MLCTITVHTGDQIALILCEAEMGVNALDHKPEQNQAEGEPVEDERFQSNPL